MAGSPNVARDTDTLIHAQHLAERRRKYAERKALAKWTRTANGDYINGPWRIRGPIFGHSMFWLYLRGLRHTPTGKYDDAVTFASRVAAAAFVAAQGETSSAH